MSAIIVIGSQWGDEGKGKVVDYLAEQANVVVRYSGGNNAGHTVVVKDEAYKLQLLPSGILYKGKTCVLGNGVVIDPEAILKEINGMKERGIDTSSLRISTRAQVLLPLPARVPLLRQRALRLPQTRTARAGSESQVPAWIRGRDANVSRQAS